MAFSFTPSADNVFNIGAFDAKTYFSELLRKVQNGAIVNISKNGKIIVCNCACNCFWSIIQENESIGT